MYLTGKQALPAVSVIYLMKFAVGTACILVLPGPLSESRRRQSVHV